MNEAIVFSRLLKAPRAKVWSAWTDPEVIKKWWGPEYFSCPSAKVDLRVGGKYIFAMHGPAGSEWDKDFYSAGVYKEIIPIEKISATDYFSDELGSKVDPTTQGQSADMPNDMEIVITLEEVESDKTRLTISYPTKSQEQYDALKKSGMGEGWGTSLDKLAKILESY